MTETPLVPPPPPQEGEPWRLAGFDRLYGLDITYISTDEARASVEVRDELLQPAGLVHGGVFAAMAESLCSAATWYGVAPERTAQGLANQTSFVRPVHDGTIRAVARCRHRGRTTWVWEVDFTDDDGRLCALVRMTVAVRGGIPQPR
jgi:1,4-dihydroxy-2-naphthoyl-CoA hydrolase